MAGRHIALKPALDCPCNQATKVPRSYCEQSYEYVTGLPISCDSGLLPH